MAFTAAVSAAEVVKPAKVAAENLVSSPEEATAKLRKAARFLGCPQIGIAPFDEKMKKMSFIDWGTSSATKNDWSTDWKYVVILIFPDSDEGIKRVGTSLGDASNRYMKLIGTSCSWAMNTLRYCLEKNKVLILMQDDVEFSLLIMRSMAEKALSAIKQIECLTFSIPREKILELLKELCTVESCDDKQWLKLCITLSHDKIANMLEITRVTVSKIMAELRDEGIVRLSERKFG